MEFTIQFIPLRNNLVVRFVKFYLPVFIFSLLISIPLLIPYVHPGYFPTHDGEWAVVRLSDMFRTLRDLQIPARYSGNLNFGFGYPLFNFTYPFPYYLGVGIHMLGLGFVETVKLMFAVTIPVSAFFMFLASRKIWRNNWAGIISSVLYLYFPYRLVDLFVRGSIGESFAFMLFPIVLFSLASLLKNPGSLFFKLLGGISYAILITSHNIMGILFTLTLGLFFIGSLRKKDTPLFKNYLFVVISGLGLSAFFWIPALLEKGNILLSLIPIADRNLYFVNIIQLLNSPWGYGTPTDPVNPFTYQIGWPFLLILSLTLIIFVLTRFGVLKKAADEKLAAVLFIGIFIFAFLLFKESKIIWKLPLLSEINYPWVVLSQLGLIASVLAGFISNFKYFKILGFAIVMLSLALYIPFSKPSNYVDRGEGFYFTNDATTTSSNELMPVWVKKQPIERKQEKVEILAGQGNIENVLLSSKAVSFSVVMKEDGIIRINTIYYPGWNLKINGVEEKINYNNDMGLMEFELPRGTHMVSASFTETPLRMVSNMISVFTLFALAFLGIKKLWKL